MITFQKAGFPAPIGQLRLVQTSRPEWADRILRVAQTLGHRDRGSMGILAWKENEDNYLCVFKDEDKISVHLPPGVGMGRGHWVATLEEI